MTEHSHSYPVTAELAERFQFFGEKAYRPEIFGADDRAPGPRVTQAECLAIAAALRDAAQGGISPSMLEAGARALCLSQFGCAETHGDARCCQAGGKDGCCLDDVRHDALACLTAALSSTHKRCEHKRKTGGGSIGESGWSSYWHCSDCGASGADSGPAVSSPQRGGE